MQKINNMIKLAEYMNIVNTLIDKHNINSLFKLEISSLVLYYQANNLELRKSDKNLLFGFFEHLNSILLSNYNDFIYITEALRILEDEKYIKVTGDLIVKEKELLTEYNKYLSKDNIGDILNRIGNLSVSAFIQEVLSNV